MVTVSVLGSGSRGNATFIRTEQVRLIIDAGLSRKEISRRLELIGEDPNSIDAILVTHEHTDHAAGLKGLMKELPAQAYLTRGAMHVLRAEQYETAGPGVRFITAGDSFVIGDAEIVPFAVPHDSAEPVAFSVTSGGVKITQLTDVGYLPDVLAEHLRGSHLLILESNHDLEMLRAGPYPWTLKQRLIGRYGHLSNTAVARFFRDQYDGLAEHILLAHLSSKNNHPELARQATARALADRGFTNSNVYVTSQDQPMVPIRL